MVLTGGYGTWRRNGDVTVYELGERPMEEDLLELERKVFGPVYGEVFTRRNRYVAAPLMAGILDRLGPVSVYLHADREDTPKDMYARMGFAPVGELYEYFTDL